MTTYELTTIIFTTVADNFNSLLVIISVGAGIKIVLDIIFQSLYSVTGRNR